MANTRTALKTMMKRAVFQLFYKLWENPNETEWIWTNPKESKPIRILQFRLSMLSDESEPPRASDRAVLLNNSGININYN